MASRMTKAEQATLIQEQAELIEELRALLHAQNEAKADKAIAAAEANTEVDVTVIDRVNRRINQYGDVLNCRVAEDYEGPMTFTAFAKALGTQLAPRGKRRTDANGRIWVDLYPSVSAPAEVAA